MRRPLKPFVTEYKQSARRQSIQQPAELALPEAERPGPKPVDLALKEPEDSYEAALRAADALFSGSPQRPLESLSGGPAAPGTTPDEPPKPEKNGGRILRVLDEEPSPQLVALEAERAPKRRGRKPGSKNKPKVALVAETKPIRGAIDLAAVSPPATPARQRSAKVALSAEALPTDRIEALTVVPRGAKRGASWVRDRLRPGEEWKRRRLPRVCW